MIGLRIENYKRRTDEEVLDRREQNKVLREIDRKIKERPFQEVALKIILNHISREEVTEREKKAFDRWFTSPVRRKEKEEAFMKVLDICFSTCGDCEEDLSPEVTDFPRKVTSGEYKKEKRFSAIKEFTFPGSEEYDWDWILSNVG